MDSRLVLQLDNLMVFALDFQMVVVLDLQTVALWVSQLAVQWVPLSQDLRLARYVTGSMLVCGKKYLFLCMLNYFCF